MAAGQVTRQSAPDQRLQLAGDWGSTVGWVVSATEGIQALRGWREVARRYGAIRLATRKDRGMGLRVSLTRRPLCA